MAADFIQRLLLQFDGDPEGAKDALKEVSGALGNLVKETESIGPELGSSIKEAFEDPLSIAKDALVGFGEGILETLGPSGVIVGAVAGGVAGMTLAFGEAAKELHELTEAAAESGEHLNDLNEKTGISVPKLSAMRYAIEAAGGDFDQFANGMMKFERTLEQHPDKIANGLSKIGLSLKDVADLEIDEKFLAISHAMIETQDSANRATAAYELFGNMGRNMIPTMMTELDGLIDRGKTLAVVWTADEAQAAQDLLIAERELKLQWEAMKETVGKFLIPIVKDYVVQLQALLYVARDVANTEFFNKINTAIAWVDAAMGVSGLGGSMRIAEKGAKALHEQLVENLSKGIKSELEPSMAKATRGWKEMDKAARDHAAAVKKAAEEHKKWIALLNEFNAVGTTTQETIDGIDGAVVEGTRFYLEHNMGVEKIAKLYGITASQVAAVKKQMDEEKKSVEATTKSIDESRKVHEQATAALNKMFAGMPTLKNMAVAMGNVQLAAKQLGDHLGYTMPDLTENARRHFWSLTNDVMNLGHAVDDVLQTAPSLIIQSLTGGGGLSGAAKAAGSLFGKDIGQSISDSLESSLSKLGTKTLGSLTKGLLSAIPAAGALLGPLASSLLGKLFSIGGPSKTELEGRSLEKKFEDSFGGFQKMMDAVGKAYEATGKGAAQAQADVKALLDAERQGPEAAQKWIDKIKGIVDASAQLGSKATSAAKDFADALSIPDAALKSYDELNEKQMALQVQLDKETDPERAADIRRQLQAVNDELLQQGAIFNETIPRTKEQADALATVVAADFGAMLKHGVSFNDAIKAISPSVKDLEHIFSGMGDVVTDTTALGGDAFKELKSLVDLASDSIAGPALQSTHSLAEGMRALDEIGLGNKQTYGELGNQIGATFDSLVKQGKDGHVVLVSMRDQIQTVWEEQQKYGFTLDETTQSMVDQAVQQGIVGPQMRSVNEQLLSVLQSIDSTLKGMTGSANNFAGALRSIPTHIETEIVTTRRLEGADTEDIPSFANRRMERVTGAGFALLHPGDVVGVPQPGQFGGISDSPWLAAMANGIDVLNDRMDAMPDAFARKVRDAIQMAG